jgi:hypothetical protein
MHANETKTQFSWGFSVEPPVPQAVVRRIWAHRDKAGRRFLGTYNNKH